MRNNKIYPYRRNICGCFFILIICLIFSNNITAQPVLSLTPVIEKGLNTPIQFVNAGDGTNRVFIVEHGADIRVYDANFKFLSVFLTVSNVNVGVERGLFSMAFHPDYHNNGLFYVFYTNTTGELELARYRVSSDPNIADQASKVVLITIPHPKNSNHNGGELHFGNDGFLYLSTGDGGGAGDEPNNAQNTLVLLGKMLRFNVNTSSVSPYYTIPEDNPFGNEIFDLGLRNPFRWSFDRQTHDMWIGDVGQDAYDEIDYRAAGSNPGVNYGWRCYEGNADYNTADCNSSSHYVFPVYAYATAGVSASIIGGIVYRGNAFPSLQGYNISADFYSGTFYKTVSNGSGGWTTSKQTLAPTGIVDFGETEDGEAYAVSYTKNSVYRIKVTSENCTLKVSLSAGTISCNGGNTTLTVTASGGKGPYTYKLNSGAYQSSNKFITEAGKYTVTVKDSKGCTNSKSITITEPSAINVTATSGTILCKGGTTTVSVSATGGKSGYAGTGTFTKGAGTHTFTVTDSKGCKGSKTITITQPSALTASLSGKTNVSCNGGSNGSITIKAKGGTSSYRYKLNSLSYQSSSTFNDLKEGTYTATVKDKNGCTATVSNIPITQPSSPVKITLAQKKDVSCKDGADGLIKVSGGGGSSPYKYSLNSGSYSTGSTFSNLQDGSYTVKVKDANGCTKSITVTIKNGTGNCSADLSKQAGAVSTANTNEATLLKAEVYPNPSETEFTLKVSSNSIEPVEIKVIDMLGRSVHHMRGSANQSYKLGQHFAPGVYIVEVLQGQLVKTIKIIKNK